MNATHRALAHMAAVVLTTAALLPTQAFAQSATPPTPTLTLGAPAAVSLGQTATLHAVLVGADGSPVEGATLNFSTSAKFLNIPGNVVLADAVTDAQGSASIDWEPRSDGNLSLNVIFAGDKQFGAAKATATVQVSGGQQLYQQHAGVVVPGLNAAPAFTRTAALAPVASPWPRLSAWPLVVVLLIVWSLYARAVAGLFTIARSREPDSSRTGVR